MDKTTNAIEKVITEQDSGIIIKGKSREVTLSYAAITKVVFADAAAGINGTLDVHTKKGWVRLQFDVEDNLKFADVAKRITQESEDVKMFNKDRNNGVRKIVAFVISIAVFVTICYISWVSMFSSSDPSLMSLSEFNMLQDGMTYQEVVEIVGGHGTILSELSILGPEYHTAIYMWEGNGTLGANANVTFQGGRLIMKAQSGLR